MITRHNLFLMFLEDMKETASFEMIEMLFNSLTDTDLMVMFGLKLIRKGYFYRV